MGKKNKKPAAAAAVTPQADVVTPDVAPVP